MAFSQQNWNEGDLANYVEIQNNTGKSVVDPDTDKDMLEKAESIQMMIRKEYIKFQKACRLVVLMNNQVKEISTRYKRVVRDNLRNYRYLLRLRLCTAEGLRNMYHEYSCRQAEKTADLEENLREIGVEPIYIDPEY